VKGTIVFVIERELKDDEIEHIEFMAKQVLHLENGLDAAAIYNIYIGDRKASAVLEDIVREDSQAETPLFPEITEAWPDYVRGYLDTSGWKLGYGYVGEVQANVSRHG
jgi:hypothetical protein